MTFVDKKNIYGESKDESNSESKGGCIPAEIKEIQALKSERSLGREPQ